VPFGKLTSWSHPLLLGRRGDREKGGQRIRMERKKGGAKKSLNTWDQRINREVIN